MTKGQGIAGAMDYVPAQAKAGGNVCHRCGHDFGEGASAACKAKPGVGVVQYCKACWKGEEERRMSWDRRFLGLAQHIAGWSKDPSTKVGAVIVRPNKTIAGLGFNGLPRGVPDSDDVLNNRELKYATILHAEVNAILHAREPLDGYTLYVWPMHPCSNCASVIAQSGIGRVVTETSDIARWKGSFDRAAWVLAEAEVTVCVLEKQAMAKNPYEHNEVEAAVYWRTNEGDEWEGRRVVARFIDGDKFMLATVPLLRDKDTSDLFA